MWQSVLPLDFMSRYICPFTGENEKCVCDMRNRKKTHAIAARNQSRVEIGLTTL